MIILDTALKSKTAESQCQIIVYIVLILLVDESHNLLQVVFGIQLRGCHIQLHLLMMQESVCIPIIESKRKLSRGVQKAHLQNAEYHH